jgi:hypothetical protein
MDLRNQMVRFAYSGADDAAAAAAAASLIRTVCIPSIFDPVRHLCLTLHLPSCGRKLCETQ